MTKTMVLITVAALNCTTLHAQKQLTHMQQLWGGYINQTRISNHWGLWLDLHLRTKDDFFKDLSTGIARTGITYYINDRLRLTAGYAYANSFPADDHSGVSQPEHRPWQQFYWQIPAKRVRLMNYIRLEERFRRRIKNSEELGDGYQFNYRARYNTMLFIPLGRLPFARNTLSVSLNEEVQLNFGKEIVYNTFDQNRLLAGFAYHTTERDYLQFGYMNIYQQQASGNKYRLLHVARIYYYHNLDLRKKNNN
jgi:hypothetical protein